MDRIGAIILAGGHSSRFGSDKAAASLSGRALVSHVLGAIPPSRSSTCLVLRADQPEPDVDFDRVVHDDPGLPDGPLRGIVTGLEALAEPWAWVIACDLPGVVPALLEALAVQRETGMLGVIPEWEGRRQPLCALYSRGAAAEFRAALAGGVRSMWEALEVPGFRCFSSARVREVDPQGRSFFNVNTVEDLDRFRSAS